MQRTEKKSSIKINGQKLKIGIVVSRFNDDITEKLLSGAFECLNKNNVKPENVKVFRVPGSFEIPLACQKLAQSKKFDALVALGCLIKGETDHYHYIAQAASWGIMEVSLKYSLPIGFGVLTVSNLKQAQARVNEGENKGKEATEAAIDMVINNK